MKISTIPNLNNAKSSINFGRYANKKVKKEVEKMGKEYVDYYGRIGCEVSIEASKRRYDALDFLEKTPYVTIKQKDGIVYAAMNKDEIEKHPKKEKLKKIFNDSFKFSWRRNLDIAYEIFKTNKQRVNQAKKILDIMDSDKDFLTAAESFEDLDKVRLDIERADLADFLF